MSFENFEYISMFIGLCWSKFYCKSLIHDVWVFFSPLWFLCKTSTWTNLILKGCGSSRVNPLTELLVLIVVFPLQIFSPWILNQYKTALSWTQVLMFQLNLCLSLCLFRMWNMQMAPGLKILARADKEQHLYILQY